MTIQRVNVETGEIETIAETAPSFPITRQEWRETASMPKTDFSRAFVAGGYMTHEEAKSAVIGQWPASKDHWLAGMTPEQRQDFELDLAGAQVIHRNYEYLDLISVNAGITPEQLDTIFGYAG